MKLSIKAGSTSQTVNIFIRDSSSTTGGGLTGLAYNTASLAAYYALPKAASVSITLATLAAVTSSWSSGGFKEIDATNMPGWYRLDLPDAALASGRFVSLLLKGAANMAPLPIEIALTATDNQSATAFITGINSLAPPANWNTDVVQTGDAYARIGASGAGLTSVTVATNNDKTGYGLTTAQHEATADALLGRNINGGSNTGRLVKQAFHFIRNKWVVSGGALTVYDIDDSTTSWTATVTGTPGADPITANDPA